MKRFGCLEGCEALILDIDNTVYDDPEYFQDGQAREQEAVAEILGIDAGQLRDRLNAHQQLPGQKPTMTEIVYQLGITLQQWSELRQKAWRPEQFLEPNPSLVKVIELAREKFLIAFATNSPAEIGRRVLSLIGFNGQISSGTIRVFGPEDLGSSKHDPAFFQKCAEILGLEPAACISIGDREKTEAFIAMKAGFSGAVIISSVEETILTVNELTSTKLINN